MNYYVREKRERDIKREEEIIKTFDYNVTKITNEKKRKKVREKQNSRNRKKNATFSFHEIYRYLYPKKKMRRK